jgi:adenosylcobyric acid synthase
VEEGSAIAALSIQGTSSFAGKSLLTTALGRSFARRGVRVAPFKAQNMSNNARVVAGGEIGVAQYLQALACGLEPEVRMNPVLVKPEGDNQSQVVVDGVANLALSRLPWRERSPHLVGVVDTALRSLLAEFDLVLVEGAGSPAEINLRRHDLTNMRPAAIADAAVVLVSDIDRGGAFAHLYGTWALLPDDERSRIGAFVLNKFRGDISLLPPGPQRLTELTGVPLLGVVPWLEHALPDEDGAATPQRRGGRPLVAVIRYPTASNLDEFRLLAEVSDVVWAQAPQQLVGADLVVLPGSKHVAADLDWLLSRGFAPALWERADAGRRILGICGGLQMLGDEIVDLAGVDGTRAGLGLLATATTFAAEKATLVTATTFATELPVPWRELAGMTVEGYEIRHGKSEIVGSTAKALPDGLGFVSGAVLGVYLHGLFEQPGLSRALIGAAATSTLDVTFERLADVVDTVLDNDLLDRLAGV